MFHYFTYTIFLLIFFLHILASIHIRSYEGMSYVALDLVRVGLISVGLMKQHQDLVCQSLCNALDETITFQALLNRQIKFRAVLWLTTKEFTRVICNITEHLLTLVIWLNTKKLTLTSLKMKIVKKSLKRILFLSRWKLGIFRKY